MENFTVTVKEGGVKRQSSDFASVFPNWKGDDERWLFVAPHDDDLCLGSGLLLQAALESSIPVRCLITTDGSQGYGSSVSKEAIIATRRQETEASFRLLGVEDVQWLLFPDGSLNLHAGARFAKPGDPYVCAGKTGLQTAYTAHMREFKPTRVFVPANTDLHPDHKTVYQELLISLFHAAGDIWPELGAPLSASPEVYEMAVYCDFPAEPNLRLTASPRAFEKKLDAILAYRSQVQIESLVQNVRKGGAVEYFRDVVFDLYVPDTYANW